MPATTFCVSLGVCRKDPDKATVAFVVASAALGSGKDTLVFLSADGVWAAVPSVAAGIDVGAPFKPLAELVAGYLAAGGRLHLCASCCSNRGIDAADLLPGAELSGSAALVEWLANGAATVCY
jgi:predicted peroxiredoxin